MIHAYTEEIEKLKQELKGLKEDSVISSEDSQMPLREISSQHNLENVEPNEKHTVFSSEADPSFSKFSVNTVL